jgi:histidinol-phosphate aminotransferase
MSVSRRGFLSSLGRTTDELGLAAMIAARGHEALMADEQGGTQGGGAGQGGAGRGGGAGQGGRQGGAGQGGRQGGRPAPPPGVEEIKISSNENPLGPGKHVLDTIVGKFPEASRYPFNSTPSETKLVEAFAAFNKVKPENITVGAGSQEILKSAMRAFTSPYRALVTAAPTFENCTGLARRMNVPLYEVKVDSQLKLDLEGMLAVARGAGLIFLNNPNNPTATVHGLKVVTDFVERVRRISPDTVILIDEAYHDYVTDADYATAIPLAMNTPNVFVARTFSKAYGMAGVRVGYAVGQTDTIKPLARVKMPYNVSVFGIAAAIAAIGNPQHIAQERARNTEVRNMTVKVFEELGCKSTATNANFIFVDVGRTAAEFRNACANQWVQVGRDFPPFEHTFARISIGTMAEMKRATEVFREVMRPTAQPGGGGGNGRNARPNGR